jgi:capsid protein
MSGGCHCPETLVFSVGRTIHDIKRDRVEETEWMSKSRVDKMDVMKQYTVY